MPGEDIPPKVSPATPEMVLQRYTRQLNDSAIELLNSIDETAMAEQDMLYMRGKAVADEERQRLSMKFRAAQGLMEETILKHIRLRQQVIRHEDKMKSAIKPGESTTNSLNERNN